MFGLIADIERAMIKPLVPNVTLITGQVMYTYPMKEILTSLREHLLETFGEQTVELAVAVTRDGDVVITAYVSEESSKEDKKVHQ